MRKKSREIRSQKSKHPAHQRRARDPIDIVITVDQHRRPLAHGFANELDRLGHAFHLKGVLERMDVRRKKGVNFFRIGKTALLQKRGKKRAEGK